LGIVAVVKGTRLNALDTPEKADHVFAGWCVDNGTTPVYIWDFNNPVSSDMTLHALWKSNVTPLPEPPPEPGTKFLVQFDVAGGTPQLAAISVTYPNRITPGAVTKSGWKLEGWYVKGTNPVEIWDLSWNVYKNMTLVAIWAPDEAPATLVTVTFNTNGGSEAPQRQEVLSGSKLTNPGDPTKTGFKFIGWAPNGDYSTIWSFASDTVLRNTELLAMWQKDTPADDLDPTDPLKGQKFTVDFNAAGGQFRDNTNAKSLTNVEYWSKLPADTEEPTCTGYKFEGWFFRVEGVPYVWSMENDVVKGNVLLTAMWSKIDGLVTETFEVIFKVDGNTVSRQRVDKDAKLTEPNDPAKAGFEFMGWYLDEAALLWDFENGKVTASMELLALFMRTGPRPDEPTDPTKVGSMITISFYTIDGRSFTKDFEYWTKIVLEENENPKRKDHKLIGWLYYESGIPYMWNLEEDVVEEEKTLLSVWEYKAGEPGDGGGNNYMLAIIGAAAGGTGVTFFVVVKALSSDVAKRRRKKLAAKKM
jgi:uncharacterized repeat protein (TIGR02543 family)